jgi:hypothetical protein
MKRGRIGAWLRRAWRSLNPAGDGITDARLRKRMWARRPALHHDRCTAAATIPGRPANGLPCRWRSGCRAGPLAQSTSSCWRGPEFGRYVVALIAAGPVFVLFATIVAGGVTSGSGGLWRGQASAVTILALGPLRATPWFAVFGTVLIAILIDPIVVIPTAIRGAAACVRPEPVAAADVVFLLLRYGRSAPRCRRRRGY